MPIYSFVCSECGSQTELNLPMTMRDNKYECLECSGLLVRKFGVGGVYVR